MATLTDPARELAEVAERLSKGSSSPGETFLAEQFGVGVWSTDFVRIVLSILERADLVASIVEGSDMDDDHKSNALKDLRQFKEGFTGNSLRQHWNNSGNGLTSMKDHGRPIQYLSSVVRSFVRYPKLTEDEITEFIGLIDAYLDELQVSDEGPAFVRQAILDGLTMFRFRLQHIGWMGSGYALDAFREVMFAYEASKQQFGNRDFESVPLMRGLRNIVTKFKEKVDTAQGWADTGQSVWKLYQLGSSVATPLLLASQSHGS